MAIAGIESLEAFDGALECAEVPHRSLILVSLSSSSVPRMSIHIYIKKITEQQMCISIRKSEKG